MIHLLDPMPVRPRSRGGLLVRLALAGVLASAASAFAGTHVRSGAINDQWNLPGNWSSGGSPSAAESSGSDPVILVFPSGPETRSETRNNIPGLRVDRLEIRRGGYRFRDAGTFRITYRSGAGANDVSVKVENAPAAARVAGLHLQRRTDGSTRISAVGEEG